jgi:16S rRNA (cytidine1402-2'-O)-methyltransferase
MPRLYIVATPIGNLEDITFRALRALQEAGVIAAEDTRVARALLSHFGVRRKRLISYNEHNRARRIPELLGLLAEHDIALITDAGTPAISDPGAELVAAARAAGHQVVAVPGPSAVAAAVSVAGLAGASFTFVGFLPRTEGDLRRLFESLQTRDEALVAFEAPARLAKTLRLIEEALPERRIAVCRELTKLHEEVFVATAAEATAHFGAPRGEIVIIIEGSKGAPPRAKAAPAASIEAEVAEMKALGLTRAQASALLSSRHGIGRRQAYALWLAEAPQARTKD